MNWAAIFDRIERSHVAIGMSVYSIGSVLQWFHHLDATYVTFTTTVLGFLGLHKFLSNGQNGNGATNGGQQ